MRKLMMKEVLDCTIIVSEQMPKVDSVEQQWRVVERGMCLRTRGAMPGQNGKKPVWANTTKLKTVLAKGFSSQAEAREYIHTMSAPKDAVFEPSRWDGAVFKHPKRQQTAALV